MKDAKDKNEWDGDYKKLLNKKDLLDQQILKHIKQGELIVRVVNLKESPQKYTETYNRRLIPPRKYTS